MEYDDLLHSELKYIKLDMHKPINAFETYYKHLAYGQNYCVQLWHTIIYTDGKFDRYGEENASIEYNRYFQNREVYIKDCSFIAVYNYLNFKRSKNSKITLYMINPNNVFTRRKIRNALLNNKCNKLDIEYSPFKDVINSKNDKNKKTNLTNAMEELEVSLAKLQTIAPMEYETLNQEYQSLLTSNDKLLTLCPLSLPSIIAIQNKVDALYSKYGGEPKRILYLFKKKNNEIISNLRSGVAISLSLKKLDSKIDELFKENIVIDAKIQNELLNQLAQMYFLYMYANKDAIDSKDLEFSYAYNNLKRIKVMILLLENNGIITDVPYDLLDINSMDDLINAIEPIKFIPLKQQVYHKTL